MVPSIALNNYEIRALLCPKKFLGRNANHRNANTSFLRIKS